MFLIDVKKDKGSLKEGSLPKTKQSDPSYVFLMNVFSFILKDLSFSFLLLSAVFRYYIYA